MTGAPPLRIALVHSFYTSRNPSGENMAVEAEAAALARAGHRVELFAARTDDLERDRLHPLRSALRVASGRGASPHDAIDAFQPDVVHVHNTFPNIARRFAVDLTVPVVHTLHNFRPVCVNALLLRDGQPCTLCPDGDPWAGLRHRCYRGSVVASAPLTWANRKGPGADPLLRRADRIVVLSDRQRDVLVRGGVAPSAIVSGANFLPEDSTPTPSAPPADGPWLFVGRLSEEKGIARLLEHWPDGVPLVIVGDGDQRDEVRERAARVGATVLGARTRAEVFTLLQSARGLVFPSICFENAPLVHLEALAVGRPVVAFRPAAVADEVERHGTGAVAPWDAAGLAAVLEDVGRRAEAIGIRSRAVFEAEHTEAAFVARAVGVYRDAITSYTAGG